MNSENSILGNQLVVMSRADLDALVEKMASNLIAMRVEAEDKTSRGNDVCPISCVTGIGLTRKGNKGKESVNGKSGRRTP